MVAQVDSQKRIDKLAELGTSVITISGGEPLMHPDLDDIIRHIRKCGMLAGLITPTAGSVRASLPAAPVLSHTVDGLASGKNHRRP